MVGLQILKRRRAVDIALARRFLDVPVANVSDCMARMFGGGPKLRPMHRGGRMAGPALTVRTRPGDNLMIHKALELVERGDVIVVDGGGDLTNSLFGEIMAAHAEQLGVAGLVINGAIRDAGAIRQGALPIFAAGATHRGPYKDGPGEINVPIALEGMIVRPGDLVIGDDDGLLCVPFEHVQALLDEALAKQELEKEMVAAIAGGTYEAPWIDATLKRLKCYVEE